MSGPEKATPQPLRELVRRSRLLGADQSLVLYGGGNTSAKGELVDFRGQRRRVLWVKGSGADMAVSADGDYPALYLDELDLLRDRAALTDEEMTDLVVRSLVEPRARRPSIETLLHAFLPFTHVDHVHADAVCALTNHAHGPEVTREALGDGFAYVDWLRPGFSLSKLVGELADRDGVVLAHHGLVTWADDSDTCYRRTMEAVDRANAYLDQAGARRPTASSPAVPDLPDEELERLLLRLRGAVCRTGRRVVRVDPRLRQVADRPDVDEVAAAGVASADHMLRIKPFPAVVSAANLEPATAVEAYAHRYEDYFARHQELLPEGHHRMHDPMPRVLLVPGVGGLTTGKDARDAEVAADIAAHTTQVASRVVDAFGAARPLPEREIFGFDYWPMELYKLTLRPPPPRFAGTVVAVTGAASGIGRAIAREVAGQGASVVLADLDGGGLAATRDEIAAAGGPEPALVAGDQSEEEVARDTVRSAIRQFGGLDGVVACAGIAVAARLEDLSADSWRRSLDVNLTSAFLLTREALRAMRTQGTGGSLVYVASKNAFGPGAGFGAYSAAKAAMVQLCRIAALEGGEIGVRANAVNPDAIFTGSRLWSEELRHERARAHGIEPDDLEDFYACRNLLRQRVTTLDVAKSVAFLLSEDSGRTTGSVLPVDGGVAAAFPR